ncbi:MAG: (d)CMP kinase [Acetobacteraceae bacterium]|jgi:cytidylate kinase|nr:(d)CMP kinase [Acetobacteraceae bacterium]
MIPAPVIAIDGPAAAGKGTLAKRLAAALGLPHLDTGLLYRAVGRRVLDRGLDPRDAVAAEAEANALTAGDLARDDLRGPQADFAASAVAAIPAVRAALVAFQRRFGSERGAVLDGRDIGTVIFPAAPVKLFVTASAEERARRRFLELRARGIAADPDQVLSEIRDRDAQDANRPVAPLKPAPDAEVIDTTLLDADAAFVRAMDIVSARLELPAR